MDEISVEVNILAGHSDYVKGPQEFRDNKPTLDPTSLST
jgi:hypothetical protein